MPLTVQNGKASYRQRPQRGRERRPPNPRHRNPTTPDDILLFFTFTFAFSPSSTFTSRLWSPSGDPSGDPSSKRTRFDDTPPSFFSA